MSTTPRVNLPLATFNADGRIVIELDFPAIKPAHMKFRVLDGCGDLVKEFCVFAWRGCDILIDVFGLFSRLEADVFYGELVDAACRICAVVRIDNTKQPVGSGAATVPTVEPIALPAKPVTLTEKVRLAFEPWTVYKGRLCGTVASGATSLNVDPEPPQGTLPSTIQLVVQDDFGGAIVTVTGATGTLINLSTPLDATLPIKAGAQVCFVWTPDNVAKTLEPVEVTP